MSDAKCNFESQEWMKSEMKLSNFLILHSKINIYILDVDKWENKGSTFYINASTKGIF